MFAAHALGWAATWYSHSRLVCEVKLKANITPKSAIVYLIVAPRCAIMAIWHARLCIDQEILKIIIAIKLILKKWDFFIYSGNCNGPGYGQHYYYQWWQDSSRRTLCQLWIAEQTKWLQWVNRLRWCTKTHDNIRTIRPLHWWCHRRLTACEPDDARTDQDGPRAVVFFSPSLRMVIGVPSGRKLGLRAVRDSAEHADGRDVYLIFEPMAAAIGIGIDVEAPEGNMIVDIGGGVLRLQSSPSAVSYQQLYPYRRWRPHCWYSGIHEPPA